MQQDERETGRRDERARAGGDREAERGEIETHTGMRTWWGAVRKRKTET